MAMKTFIYTNKCLEQKIDPKKFESYIENIQKYELYNAKSKGKLRSHYLKWHNIDVNKQNQRMNDGKRVETHIQELCLTNTIYS